MTNVEIYDTSNSELSSDEYSHEEDDDALMEAAVSKQASPGNTPMKAGPGAVTKPKSKPSGNPDDESLTAADAAGKDQIVEAAAEVLLEPPFSTTETICQIRQMQSAPFKLPFIFLKRRSFLWLRYDGQRDENYRFQIKHNRAVLRRRRYSSYSRSVSYSRSNSRSLSRSRSRSLDRSYSSDRSRSVSHSPELICLDDTENEDSPDKPEDAKSAKTPIKENTATIIKPPPPAQPQFEQLENEKSNENGTSSVLAEFLMIKEPKQSSQAGIELNKLTASLELEQAIPDTTVVQQGEQVQEAAEEPMPVDVTLKRRRSVTPPMTNEKQRIVEDDDDTIEYLPAVAQNLVDPVLKMQPSELAPKAPVAPTANPIQSQPAFKLSSPYTLALSPGPNAKQNINLAALSHSLNTPTPQAVPMEISYPTENLPPITKSNLAMAVPEQPGPSVTVPAYASPSYAAQIQWAPPPQAAHAQVSSQQEISAQCDPPRAAIPLHSATSGALEAPFGTQRVLPAQVVPPRALQPPTQVPLQVNSPRATAPLPADPSKPTVPKHTATPLRPAPPQQQPPAQVQQEQAQVPVNVTNFAVPQQPQPRRSETVSTQTQASQSESSPSTDRQKPATPDLKNSDANFHYRLKELFPSLDAIFKEKLDSVGPDPKSVMEEIDADVKTLDSLLAKKEDEWNRLFHLRCMKMELRGRVERMERVSIIKKLLPSVVTKSCSSAEIYELQESLLGEHIRKLPFRSGPSSLEQCLNNAEVNHSDIQKLRGALNLKAKAPAASFYHLEEKHQHQQYRRNSLPIHQALVRGATEDLDHLERDCELPPANKRPRLLRAQDRYAHEMTNSTANMATSSFLNKFTVPGKQSYYSQISPLDNFSETESQIKPLYNSSPMVSQRNMIKRQYDELHSTSNRNEEEEEAEISETSSMAKGLKKSQRRDSCISNGKEAKVCQHCQVHEAIYLCTSCQNQCYCSTKCQLLAWDSHSKYCGK